MFFERKRKLIILIIFCIGLFLRVYKLDSYGIWQDEQWCISTSVGIPYIMYDTEERFFNQWSKPWRDKMWAEDTVWKNKKTFTSSDFWKLNTVSNVLNATIYASNNPVYNVSLHFWIKLLGISDFSVRFFSVIWGCLTIILVFLLAQLLFKSSNVALLSSLLIAIHPILIYESQSAKAYSMSIFLSLLAVYFFIRIIKGDNGKLMLFGYFISLLLAILTHMLTIAVFYGICMLMLLFVTKKQFWIKICLLNGLIIIIYTLWLINGGFESINFLSSFTSFIRENVNNPEWSGHLFFISPTPINLLRGLEKFLLAIFGNTTYSLGLRLRELWGLALIPGLLILLTLLYKKEKEERRQFFYLITMIVSLIIFATVVSIRDKQVLQLGPLISVYGSSFACILLAAAVYNFHQLKKKMTYLFYGLLTIHLIAMGYSTFNIYYGSVDHFYDFEKKPNIYLEAANKIKNVYTDKDTIVFSQWHYAQCTNLYLKDAPYIIQKIDTMLQDKGKVHLARNSTNQKIVLFDFATPLWNLSPH